MLAPDTYLKVKYNKANKVWHGGYKVNYVANYRFATQMASVAGKTSAFTKTEGQSSSDYSWMSYCYIRLMRYYFLN